MLLIFYVILQDHVIKRSSDPGHRSSGDIMIFVYPMVLQEHVFKVLCDSMFYGQKPIKVSYKFAKFGSIKHCGS